MFGVCLAFLGHCCLWLLLIYMCVLVVLLGLFVVVVCLWCCAFLVWVVGLVCRFDVVSVCGGGFGCLLFGVAAWLYLVDCCLWVWWLWVWLLDVCGCL